MIIDDEDTLWIGLNDKYLLFLPDNFKKSTISTAHDTIIGGHRDLNKTLARIKAVYWWPSIFGDVKDYIKACETCQKVRGPKSKLSLKQPLRPHRLAKRFNERVHVDLIGPLLSNSENKYVLVMSDAFTKWLELIPLPDKRGETVIKAIYEQWICKHSAMQTLYSDNGKEFKNSDMEELCKNFKIEHKTTLPYHAQANAQCERQNRTIISYLKAFLDGSTKDWESLLPPCQLSYNTQVHQSTGFTPYYLRFFMDPSVPFQNLLEPRMNYSENWVNEAMLRLHKTYQEAYKNLNKANEVQTHQYNKGTNERKFEPGDLVLVSDKRGSRNENVKLIPEWKGPFIITKITGPMTALVKKTPHSKQFHVHLNHHKNIFKTKL